MVAASQEAAVVVVVIDGGIGADLRVLKLIPDELDVGHYVDDVNVGNAIHRDRKFWRSLNIAELSTGRPWMGRVQPYGRLCYVLCSICSKYILYSWSWAVMASSLGLLPLSAGRRVQVTTQGNWPMLLGRSWRTTTAPPLTTRPMASTSMGFVSQKYGTLKFAPSHGSGGKRRGLVAAAAWLFFLRLGTLYISSIRLFLDLLDLSEQPFCTCEWPLASATTARVCWHYDIYAWNHNN